MGAQARIDKMTFLKVGVLVVLLLLVVFVGTSLYYLQQKVRIKDQQEAYNNLLFEIAENGVRAHIRNDMYNPIQLDDWFTGLSVAAGLGGLCLGTDKDGTVICTGIYKEDEALDGYHEIKKEVPELQTLMHPGRRRGGLRGPGAWGGWQPLPPGPYIFTLAVDPTPWFQRIASLRNHTMTGGGLASVCVLLAALLVLLRERQQHLRRHLGEAEAAASRQALLARLGAGLAHETKNPLGLIRGMAQGIADTSQNTLDTRDRALRIIDETDRVAGQIDNFLSLAKPVETRVLPVSLKPLFENIAALVHDECNAAGITFRVKASDLTVLADAELLRKALLNLVLNAFKACKQDDEVFLYAEKTGGRYGRIVVRDTGCGIAPDDLPRVTEPYYSRFKEGTGLGLTITAEIVQKFGGRLDLDSEQGVGTTVRITHLLLTEEPL